MPKKLFGLVFTFGLIFTVFCQQSEMGEVIEVWDQPPPVVEALEGSAPSDAIILFNGTNWDEWVHQNDDRQVEWKIEDGAGVVVPETGSIKTKRSFGSCQLHIEWRAPIDTAGLTSQGRGNSGVFLQTKYEVQVLDSYRNNTYNNGQAGSIYKQHIPLVNAMRPPGTWQVYDIIYTAPTFNDEGNVESPAFFTVFHNGVLIQNHVDVKGVTVNNGTPYYEKHGPLPLSLQDHNNPVAFRNIWIREL